MFEEASVTTGLVHSHQNMDHLVVLARNNAAGGAAGDFNNDGLHDLFVLGGGAQPDRMFINDGNGSFTDMAPAWGLDRRHHSFGASGADFDADGDLDLYITSYGPAAGPAMAGKHLLLRNDAAPGSSDRQFVDIGVSAGVHLLQPGLVDGTGSGWGDYDLDGDLDLYVCSYRHQVFGNRLFRNDGPDAQGVWRFTDTTQGAGVLVTGVQGFLPRFADMNGDRYPELILIGDTGSTRYFVNDGDGSFTDRTDATPDVSGANAMGLDIGDVNEDGLADWYVTNIAYPGNGNMLLIQDPDGSFDDHAQAAGVQNGYWGWGTLLIDLDHDTDIDIAETNGSIGTWSNRPSVVFLNDGDGTAFTESAASVGLVHAGQGRGLIRLDLENDGDADLVILCNNQPMAVFRNALIGPDGVIPADAHWLRVVLDTRDRPALPPNGIGSVVRVLTDSGERVAWVDNASNHCTTSPAEAHFGLGTQPEVRGLRVEWADGSFTSLGAVAADRVLTITAPAHPADFDGSGVVDAQDAAAFVGAFLAGNLSADTDGDWDLDFFDAAAFLVSLGDGM